MIKHVQQLEEQLQQLIQNRKEEVKQVKISQGSKTINISYKNIISRSSILVYTFVMVFNVQDSKADNLEDSKGIPNPTESDNIKTLEARLLEVTKENELLSVKEIQQVRLLQ